MKNTTNKSRAIKELLKTYAQEIEALHGINIVWNKLKESAKNKCAEDFDKALIARETALEEIIYMGEAGVEFELNLYDIDQRLLKMNVIIKTIYSFDVNNYLNIKPKALKGK